MKKNRHIFRVKKPLADLPLWVSLPRLADCYRKAEAEVTPIVYAEGLDELEAVALVAAHGHEHITGQRVTAKEQIVRGMVLVRLCWERGLFTPSALYPYSLQQTIAAWDAPDPARQRRRNEDQAS